MLYFLAQTFRDDIGPLNVLTYHTVRAGGAAVTGFLFCLIFGPIIIERLRALKIGQYIKKEHVAELHELHQGKSGTPTMGGAMIIIGATVSLLFWGRLDNRLLAVALIMLVALGAVGFMDDYVKLRRKHNSGLSARAKFAGQIIAGLLLGAYVIWAPVAGDQHQTFVGVPGFKDLFIPLGLAYALFVTFIIVASSNAVNLTDGLDGLAIGASIMSILAYTGIAYVISRSDWSEYLFLTHVPEASELFVFGAALLGTGLGFLWFNAHPAEVFMGDTGSLALGGAIGTMAVLTKQELLLAVVGGLFVIEAGSVILQVLSFKLRGKRIFKMAPVHHHFELMGWSETKVVIRFWILALLFALMSLGTLKLR